MTSSPEVKRDAIDVESIRLMVDGFYTRVREDPELGPIFASRIENRWPEHLDKMVDFWTTALLHERRYFGNPRVVHGGIAELRVAHFDRWLGLFEATLHDLFVDDVAAIILAKSQAMARALTRALSCDAA
jgi:hemoglobin